MRFLRRTLKRFTRRGGSSTSITRSFVCFQSCCQTTPKSEHARGYNATGSPVRPVHVNVAPTIPVVENLGHRAFLAHRANPTPTLRWSNVRKINGWRYRQPGHQDQKGLSHVCTCRGPESCIFSTRFPGQCIQHMAARRIRFNYSNVLPVDICTGPHDISAYETYMKHT